MIYLTGKKATLGHRRSKRKGCIKKVSGCAEGIAPLGEDQSIWEHVVE